MKAWKPVCAALIALATLPATASLLTYKGTLSDAGEAGASPAGTGSVLVTLDDTTSILTVNVIFSGLIGDVTASHIHCCTTAAGTGTAGVATVTPTFTGFPLGATFGSYDHVFDMTLASSYNPGFITANGGTVSTAFTAFLNGIDAGKAYLNIHSSFAPGGEIRGFLSPVPEPASYGLMGLGLLGLGAFRRRRNHA